MEHREVKIEYGTYTVQRVFTGKRPLTDLIRERLADRKELPAGKIDASKAHVV